MIWILIFCGCSKYNSVPKYQVFCSCALTAFRKERSKPVMKHKQNKLIWKTVFPQEEPPLYLHLHPVWAKITLFFLVYRLKDWPAQFCVQ